MNTIVDPNITIASNVTGANNLVSWVKWLVDQLVKQQFFHDGAVQFLVDIAPSLDIYKFRIDWKTQIKRVSNSMWELENSTHTIRIEYFTPRSIEIISFSKKAA